MAEAAQAAGAAALKGVSQSLTSAEAMGSSAAASVSKSLVQYLTMCISHQRGGLVRGVFACCLQIIWKSVAWYSQSHRIVGTMTTQAVHLHFICEFTSTVAHVFRNKSPQTSLFTKPPVLTYQMQKESARRLRLTCDGRCMACCYVCMACYSAVSLQHMYCVRHYQCVSLHGVMCDVCHDAMY